MKKIYMLSHKYLIDKNKKIYENKFIGCFFKKSICKETVKKFKKLDGFKKYPNGFVIETYKINKIYSLKKGNS